MKILAIETSLAACSVAFVDGVTPLAHRFQIIGRGHGEVLIPMIDQARSQAAVEFADLDLIAVCVGPGTFTGVRVGVATARALSLAAHVPTRGFVSLEILAAAAVQSDAVPADHGVTAVFDARRGEVYHQSFGPGLVATTPPALNTVKEAARLTPNDRGILVGSGASLLAPHLAGLGKPWSLADAPDQPDARVLASLAVKALADSVVNGQPPPAAEFDDPVRPLYIRAPDAKLPGDRASEPATGK
jgi:tRNA threonylcarbamoyladenosine biosynthesis protein TsaB